MSSIKSKLVLLSVCVILTIVICSCLVMITPRSPTSGNIVIRMDDIQDYYLHDAQIRLLNYSVSRGYSVTLGIIAKNFGLDVDLVEAVKKAVSAGSEVAVHGWTHGDLTDMNESQQYTEFLRASNRIRNTVAVSSRVLIPPTYVYSEDTLVAMKMAGYDIVSGYVDLDSSGMTSSGVVSVPATVEWSDRTGDQWTIKSVEALLTEIDASISSYGYAVVATHPVEFVENGTLDESAFGQYCEILDIVSSRTGFTTLEGLVPNVSSSDSNASNIEITRRVIIGVLFSRKPNSP